MKKFIPILWLIIISGTIFILFKLLAPSPVLETPPTPETSQENSPKSPLENTAPINTPQTFTEYLAVGDQYYSTSNYEAAINAYQIAGQINPNSIDALTKLAQAYLKNNQPLDAKSAYVQASKLDHDSIEVQLGIAQSLINMREIEKAKDLIWKLDEKIKKEAEAEDQPIETPEQQKFVQDTIKIKYYTAMILILYKDYEGAQKLFGEILESASADQTTRDYAQIFLDAYTTFAYYQGGEMIHLQTLLSQAFTQVEQNEAAIPLIFDVINTKSNYKDAWVILGYAYLTTNKIPDAIDALKQAKTLDSEKPETLFYLGLAYFAQDDLDQAILFLEEAEKAGYKPKDQVKLKLGDLYLLKQEYEKSAKYYEGVLSLNDNNLDIFIRAIWINIEKLDRTGRAFNLAKRALKSHPEEAMSYNLVGWSLITMDKYEAAQKYLTKAIEINPNLEAAYLNFGWLEERQGSNILAKEYYKKAYSLGKGNSISRLAIQRFNNIVKKENLYQTNISSPSTP